MFVWFCELQMILVFACTALLRERMGDTERAGFWAQGEVWHAEQQRRSRILLAMAARYPSAIIANGGDFADADGVALGHLQQNMGRFAARIGRWVMEIPSQDVRASHEMLDERGST